MTSRDAWNHLRRQLPTSERTFFRGDYAVVQQHPQHRREDQMSWVQRYMIHILLTLLLALTALTWNNNTQKIADTATQEAATAVRVSVLETELGDLNRQLAEAHSAQLRMEEKIDTLIEVSRKGSR